jgi:bacillithiol biosynthesis cysteine-adding enzyme BshC
MKIVESLGLRSGFHSTLIQQLLKDDPSLASFHRGLAFNNTMIDVATNRAANFDQVKRDVLVYAIKNQYQHIAPEKKIIDQIDLLSKPNTVTVTTGHQLNIFTGPLYFWYKILDVINMVEKLQVKDPLHHYVPIFWMASEDHDFEEINHFFIGEKKVKWNNSSGGPVGRLATQEFKSVIDKLNSLWNNQNNKKELLALFESCYLDELTLAKATRKLIHHIFGSYGILVVDGDDTQLKSLFVPILKKEVSAKRIYENVTNTNQALSALMDSYKPQVNPREINMFYMHDTIRERIVIHNNMFGTTDNPKKWTLDSLHKEIDDYPQRFSPNVLMRPLYQECVLPNIAYVGGGNELAYWLQLKATFNSFDIPYPLLQHRSAVLLMSEKQVKKCNKLGLTIADLFLPTTSLINNHVRKISDIDIDFTPQRNVLVKQFEAFYSLANKTDKSFLGAVQAQEKKQLKGLNSLEKRLLKAQRKKLQDHILRITDMRFDLFPNNRLQERTVNFSSFVFDEGLIAYTNKLKAVLSEESEGLIIVQY